ncbi:pyridoxamine 5'-phosphate oxidase family protein [Desulfitobacterium metallireducens]|uniref:MFS transporter n=1 Tax=Desulfitobacterium metallireducens DSM 15288 TaxID=871968 RepID=W0EBV1_9FIRM|nr:pyridoxamine 5'-phosphate oxidase family protein [Desulfitobacterium metallireducens]AHF08227.1 MFS transporter [Desulfitobacterium metallireducens DSM 15288]
MFHELRRQDRKMEDGAIKEALFKAEYGTLSTVDAEGNPYGVPLSYVYNEKLQTLYFHCAREGHKLDNMAINNKASFCVVSEAQTLPDRFSVKFQSVIAFGKVSEVNEGEKIEALTAFLIKYSREFMEKGVKYLEADEPNCRVFKLEVKHLTGKIRLT